MSNNTYYSKKLDGANSQRSKEELERMVRDRGQTLDQRDSAKRVLKEK